MYMFPFVFIMTVMPLPYHVMQNAITIPQTVIAPIREEFNNPEKELLKIRKYKIPGQKSIVVVSTKCPTELVGISTPSSKVFHNLIDAGMSCINKTSILPIELQQVCV